MPSRSFRVGRSRTGLGLFATDTIDKGEFIVEYRGRRLTTKEAMQREARHSPKYMFELNSRWTIDGSNRKNLARYTNHSCRPNAESDVVKGKIIVRAIKRIRPGDEITFNYGRDYFDLFIKPKGCQCVKCRAKRSKQRAEQRVRRTAVNGSANAARSGA
jgi:SET domain-containing protein